MLKNLFVMLCAFLIVACNSDNLEDAEQFSELLVEDISTETRSGPSGCYEIVFPITIEFPDGTSVTANSMQEARLAGKEWKENNPDIEGRPKLSFPVELINDEGDLLTVDSRQELRKLIRECRKEQFQNHKGRVCFKLVYPVGIVFPDGTSTEFEDRMTMKLALREWRMNNPDADERPSLDFPQDVEMKEDGTIVTVNSREELKELKDNCN